MPKSLPELSNDQIDKMMTSCPYYAGCFSKDQLPTTAQLNGKFAIVNMQNSKDGGGTHWVLLYDVLPNTVVYFDSEGQYPPKSIAKIMKKSGKEQVINDYMLQKLGSTSCGWWCMRAANALMQGYTIEQFAKMYSLTNPDANESLLKRQFHR